MSRFRFMKALVVITLTVTLGLGSLWASGGLYDAYKQNFGDARWQTKLNNFIDACSASYTELSGRITNLSNMIANWIGTDSYVTLIQATPTYVDGDTFTVPGDFTSRLTAGKQIQVSLGTDGLKPNSVASSSYGGGVTTVNLSLSNLTSNLAAVYVAATRDGNWPNGPGYVVAADYGSPSRATLVAADTAAATAGKQLVITPGTWTIDSDTTLAAALDVKPGAILAVSTTKTLTLNSSFKAGLNQVFSLAGTGAVSFGAGTVQEVNVLWFGSNTTAITGAIAAAPSGATVRFNAGQSYTFSPASTLTVTGKSLYLTCDPGVEVDVSGATASPAIAMQGSVGTYYALGGTIYERGALSITAHATLAASLATGDLIFISTDPSKGGSGSGSDYFRGYSGYYKGEFAEVKSVSGTTVNLMTPLQDSYTASKTVAARITPISGGLRDFRAKGASTASRTMLVVRYSRDFTVDNSHFTNFGTSGGTFYFGFNLKINRSSTSGFYASGGTGFPFDIATCQNVQVSNCKVFGGFQSFCLSGANPGLEPVRNVLLGPGNILVNNTAELKRAVGIHANVEGLHVFGNILYGGADFGAANCTLENNEIHTTSASNTAVQLYHRYYDTDFAIIKNNRFYCPDFLIGASSVFVKVSGGNSTELTQLEISGNVFDGKIKAIELERDQNNHTDFYISHARITGNTAYMPDNGSGYEQHFVRTRGYSSTYKLELGELQISHNNIDTTYPTQVYMEDTTINDLVVDDNNVVYSGALNGISVNVRSAYGALVDRVLMRRNVMINSPNSRQYNYVEAASYIEFSGNLLDNFSTNQGAYLAAADILFTNNRLVNGSGNVGLAGRYFRQIWGNASVETWGTAAPASGTWAVGDRCVNSAPAVGRPKAWTCTVAGTPGTWVSEGNL